MLVLGPINVVLRGVEIILVGASESVLNHIRNSFSDHCEPIFHDSPSDKIYLSTGGVKLFHNSIMPGLVHNVDRARRSMLWSTLTHLTRQSASSGALEALVCRGPHNRYTGPSAGEVQSYGRTPPRCIITKMQLRTLIIHYSLLRIYRPYSSSQAAPGSHLNV